MNREADENRRVAAGDPRHVAFIMDGNGRWASERGLPRALGHKAGADTVRRITEFAVKRGVPYLTLYAFSTENWSRPRDEVDALMTLLADYLESELPTMQKNGVRLRLLGDPGALAPELAAKLARTIDATSANAALNLTLAINYGGRDEIVRAARLLAEEAASGMLSPSGIDESSFARRLDTRDLPDPDLIVRTAGEMRLSNFLVWQAAYSEFYFTSRRWPDFTEADFEEALAAYRDRVRKFGGAGD